MTPQHCCICGEIISDPYGHNAQPVRDGRCCWECNIGVVVPARFELSVLQIKESKQ